MITIIDYGVGNIRAYINLYERINVKIKVAYNAADLKSATKIILPGVGAFDYAMTRLNSSGMRETITELVLVKKLPIIGICVGMQMLGEISEEGELPGLGWIPGKIKLFDSKVLSSERRLPHMGWNNISHNNDNLFGSVDLNNRFYFLHSYYFECENQDDILATTEFGVNFTSAIKKDNIYGVQFHPEKSHTNGVQLLKNFANI
jgi:glutamine amidotransferase